MKNTLVHNPLILFAILLLSVGFISYSTRSESKSVGGNKPATKNSDSGETKPLVIEPFIDTLEFFVDSTDFGLNGKTRIELCRIDTDTSAIIEIRLFAKQLKNWKLRDECRIPADAMMSFVPEIKDFNRDGFKDILFFSGEAARGINEIKTLVLFDQKQNKLIWIKNSESYPNIRYNAKLRCLDSWRVYGGESTHFLRLKGDSLVEFASVEHYDKRIIVEQINSKGERREIKTIPDESFGCDFCRFSNYDPIEVE